MTHETWQHRGFTLIELIVVVVLLGVVIGLVAPRMMSKTKREAEIAANGVRMLVSASAHRDSISRTGVALHYDRDRGVLELLSRSEDPDRDHSEVAGWRVDPLVEPVILKGLELSSALFDGQEMPSDQWTVEFPRTEPRPQIALIVETSNAGDAKRGWVIELLPHATSAAMSSVASDGTMETRALLPVDLDAAGLSEEPW